MAYLKKKEIEKAIETLKGLEKKDKTTMSRVASNISWKITTVKLKDMWILLSIMIGITLEHLSIKETVFS